jgi:hypothetical protein
MEDLDLDLDTSAGADPDSELDLVQSQKRKGLPSSLSPAPKRVCTPARTASPTPSVETPLLDAPYHVLTVTNNNRRSNLRI